MHGKCPHCGHCTCCGKGGAYIPRPCGPTPWQYPTPYPYLPSAPFGVGASTSTPRSSNLPFNNY